MVALVRLVVVDEVELADPRVVVAQEDGFALDLHLRAAHGDHVPDTGDDAVLLGLVVLGLLLVPLQGDLVAVGHEVLDRLVTRVQRGLRPRADVRATGGRPALDLAAVLCLLDLLALVGTGLCLRLTVVEEPDQLLFGADRQRGFGRVAHLDVLRVLGDVGDEHLVELVLLVHFLRRRVVGGGLLEHRNRLCRGGCLHRPTEEREDERRGNGHD
ncbi:hypothetical protein BBK82_18225 [Lentzea guizhouensis]|uniref:Uncharacterized protein n=1 Tax=Lentzea guizhouensis TaxID=1586287 RepID=A0A1B2HJ09_9PSEU|nr:hypothetical protein BBK82_18225 [Lentzea guizhouensis]